MKQEWNWKAFSPTGGVMRKKWDIIIIGAGPK